jgi:hypothetical protein
MKVQTIVIAVVVALLVLAGTGYGAYSMGLKAGQAQCLAARSAFLAARGGGNGGGFGGANGTGTNGTGNGQFNPDNFVNGQIKTINGNVVEVSTAQSVVKIDLGNNTQIFKYGTGSASDLQVGQRITVQGTRNSDGSLAAQTLQIGRPGQAARNNNGQTTAANGNSQ